MNSLKFPEVIKKAPKTLKAILNLFCKVKQNTKPTDISENNKLSTDNDVKN